MRQWKLAVSALSFSLLVSLLVLWSFSAKPALAGFQTFSGTLAACSGGGVDVDLVATGTVEDVVASSVSSRIEVRVDRVLLGDRDKSGETLFIDSDSGKDGGNSDDVRFREGARYELYLQDEGDEWKTNICLGTRELTENPQTEANTPVASASPGSLSIPETGGPNLLTLAALTGLTFVGLGAAFWRTGRRSE